MNRLFFKGHIPLIVSVSLATIPLPTLRAEPHCPGNVASLPLHLVIGHLFTMAVSINHSGPYDFLLDSGTQITMIDPSVAAELHLDSHGGARFVGAGSLQSASVAQLDLVEAGSHAVARQKVLVYDLQSLHSADLHIRGILGEDFLEHFDMLIDSVHSLLCLDNSASMRAALKGPHIPLLAPAEPEDGVALPGLLIIAARLSDGTRPVRLVLDSGTTAPVLFDTIQYLSVRPAYDVPLSGSGVEGTQQILSALPPQDVKIGSVELPRVLFFSLAGIREDARTKGLDGVLPAGLFRRVFIDHADHFAVLEPR
jgi:hypothetical protein